MNFSNKSKKLIFKGDKLLLSLNETTYKKIQPKKKEQNLYGYIYKMFLSLIHGKINCSENVSHDV